MNDAPSLEALQVEAEAAERRAHVFRAGLKIRREEDLERRLRHVQGLRANRDALGAADGTVEDWATRVAAARERVRVTVPSPILDSLVSGFTTLGIGLLFGALVGQSLVLVPVGAAAVLLAILLGPVIGSRRAKRYRAAQADLQAARDALQLAEGRAAAETALAQALAGESIGGIELSLDAARRATEAVLEGLDRGSVFTLTLGEAIDEAVVDRLEREAAEARARADAAQAEHATEAASVPPPDAGAEPPL